MRTRTSMPLRYYRDVIAPHRYLSIFIDIYRMSTVLHRGCTGPGRYGSCYRSSSCIPCATAHWWLQCAAQIHARARVLWPLEFSENSAFSRLIFDSQRTPLDPLAPHCPARSAKRTSVLGCIWFRIEGGSIGAYHHSCVPRSFERKGEEDRRTAVVGTQDTP